jgi:predicted amidophosphoribosyltransferase
MNRWQMGPFRLNRNPLSGDLLLLVTGPLRYKAILSRAFPSLHFSAAFPDRFGQFDWGTYLRRPGPADEAGLQAFCQLLQQVVHLEDDLDECFALSYHTQTSPTGGYERTVIGQLVRAAKPYDRAASRGDRQRAAELAALFADFIGRQPTYQRAELIVAAPPSNAEKDFDLPALLASETAKRVGRVDASAGLRKTRATRPMKDCVTIQEKVENLVGAFHAEPAVFAGKSVVVLDDIYQSGFTINEVGRVLRQADARLVLGLTATKTTQDLREDASDEL